MDTGLATPESHVRDLHDHLVSRRKKGALDLEEVLVEGQDDPARAEVLRAQVKGARMLDPSFDPRERLDPCIQAIYPGREHALFRVEDWCSCSPDPAGIPRGPAGAGNLI
jgi:hypothetical protein